MKTIVVTAATGNIGAKLVRQLLGAGHKVIAVTRDANKAAPLAHLGADVRQGALDDEQFLTSTFSGADAVFALIPPEYGAESFRGRQNVVGDVIARAIRASGIRKVVNLSSLGAEHAEGVGPIKGLHDQEQRLNRIEGIDLTHLRAAYFYENSFFGAALVKDQSIFGTAVAPEVAFPHVATQDIARIASDLLVAPVSTGIKIVEAISEDKTTMSELTKALSEAAGKPVGYVAFPYDGTRSALVASGLSQDVADQFVELYDAMNRGLIHSNGMKYPIQQPLRFQDFACGSRAVFGA